MNAFYLTAARGLTLARLASIPLFLFLLVQTSRAGPQQWRLSLLLLYVCIVLSDFLDGRLGRVGPWVPAGVAVLGGRFLLRNLRHQPTLPGRLIEDRAGKAAGVIYYLLVGAVAFELSVEGKGVRWLIARAGDVVFLYTLFLLLRRSKGGPSSSDP